MNQSPHFDTLAVHAGQFPDPSTGAVMTPIYQTSTYKQSGLDAANAYEYSRTGNPTRAALEECLAALEHGRSGLAFASGMAAIDAVVHLLEPGDHILASDDLYGGTHRLFQHVYAKFGIQVEYASPISPGEFVDNTKPNTKLIWLESPTNPLMGVCDIQAISEAVKSKNGKTIVAVDNTFATPYLQRPLDLGVDIIVHSTTKYLGGHSDVIGGAIVVNDPALAEQLAFMQNAIGAVPGPMDCFLVLRGIKTLALRMERHSLNAFEVASYLEAHPKIEWVGYPFLPSHPQHELSKKQMKLGGGMLSFVVKGGATNAKTVVENTNLITLAESLGGVESLIEIPALMTHTSTSESTLKVEPDLIRLSVGIEFVQDLIADLAQSLDRI